MRNKLVVPIDFTQVSSVALDHAAKIAERLDAEIHLLHVISGPDEREDAENRLKAFMESRVKEYSKAKLMMSIREGSIFGEIGHLSKEISASLIIMGTHGMRGMQFLVGSNALRVVSSSETPFIIVQERKIRDEGYDDIVVPLDLSKETKQKLLLVVKMARYFKAKVHLVSPFESDEYLKNALNRNLKYASDMMREAGLGYEIKILDQDAGSFSNAIIRYSASIEADLIAIMNLKSSLASLLGGGYTQQIITNDAQIPVLLVNPKESGLIDIFGV